MGVGQTTGIRSVLLDMLTLRFLADIQVEMLGNGWRVWTRERWGWSYKWKVISMETVFKAQGVDEITQSSFSN